LVAGLPIVSGSGVVLVREKVKSSAQAPAVGAALAQQLPAGGDPPQLLDEAVGVAELEGGVPLGAVVVQLGRPAVADVGAPAPEVVALDVGNGDTDAEVMEVVGGAELGHRGAGQGGDGVQAGARGEPAGQLGPGDVAGHGAARHAQHRGVVAGHRVLTSCRGCSVRGAQGAPSSE
jgi:hypothetical protein